MTFYFFIYFLIKIRVQLPCPMNFNPADHYIHVLAVTPGNENDCKKRIKYVRLQLI